ncbi:MAG TPA: superoxide dismutase family protein [Longimicrobiaceae bacterium]|nr:superoxide dismutase family protein [Longimicrobiaceae bacterium]
MTKSTTLAAACLLLAACGGDAAEDDGALVVSDTAALGAPGAADTMGMGTTPAGDGATATAAVRDAAGRDLGTLTLAGSGDRIQVSGTLRGVTPGTHAIHIHAVGQCEPPFQSAGPHWNPTSMQHGTENPQGPHMGDMPNLEVGADSTATVNVSTPAGAMLGGANGLLDADGAAVVVHATADDYRSDPAGNAGDRVACGVVTGA